MCGDDNLLTEQDATMHTQSTSSVTPPLRVRVMTRVNRESRKSDNKMKRTWLKIESCAHDGQALWNGEAGHGASVAKLETHHFEESQYMFRECVPQCLPHAFVLQWGPKRLPK